MGAADIGGSIGGSAGGAVGKGPSLGLGMLGGGIGGMIGGLLSGDAPTAKTVDLDQGTKNLISDQGNQALKGKDDLYNQATEGVGMAQNQFQQGTDQENAAFGGTGGSTSDAIQNKYKNALGNELENYKAHAGYDSYKQSAQRMAMAQANQRAQAAVKSHAFSMQMQSQLMADQTRNQVLSSVLGIGGKLGGYAMAGAFSSPGGGKTGGGGSGGGGFSEPSDSWSASMFPGGGSPNMSGGRP